LSQELNYWTYSYFSYDDPDQYAVDQLLSLRTETAYEFPLSRYGGIAFGYSYFHRHVKQTFHLKEHLIEQGFIYTESGKPSLEVWNEPLFGRHEVFVLVGRSWTQNTIRLPPSSWLEG